MTTGAYETIIGLEVHVQLKTRTKIFSACPAPPSATEPPNTYIDPLTLGLPGTLPVLNAEAVRMATMMGLATGCRIRRRCRFARKHYFYPDLPKGYQISQYDEPLCEDGHIDIDVDGQLKRVRILRIHLEEDAGKTIHDADRGESLVDYNRAGVPLIEIVSQPDLRSPDEAIAYLQELRRLVRYLGIGDANMEEGNFRCDANLSLRPRGQEKLGTKTEVKNMNSFRAIKLALSYEEQRQRLALEAGERIVQETRLWDADAGRTEPMRSKEEAHDYRYFPEPDLMPLVVSDAFVAEVEHSLPELPRAKYRRYIEELGLNAYDAGVLTAEPELARYYEAVLARWSKDPKRVANWVTTELLGKLGRDKRSIDESPVAPEALAVILDAIDTGKISGKMAKGVFDRVYREGVDPAAVIEEMGGQITDEATLRALVEEVVGAHPNEVARYRAGKKQLLGFFVGQIMRQTRGRANPQLVNRLLRETLDADAS